LTWTTRSSSGQVGLARLLGPSSGLCCRGWLASDPCWRAWAIGWRTRAAVMAGGWGAGGAGAPGAAGGVWQGGRGCVPVRHQMGCGSSWPLSHAVARAMPPAPRPLTPSTRPGAQRVLPSTHTGGPPPVTPTAPAPHAQPPPTPTLCTLRLQAWTTGLTCA
jgi:hypothetical protein